MQGSFGLYLYLMYSDLIVQVLAVIPGTACMWDSLLYFYLAPDYASYILQFGPLFTGHTILLYFVTAGIGIPPPPPSAQVPSHKKRLVAPGSLVSSGSSPSAHYLPHISLSDTPFCCLVIVFLQRTSVIRFAPHTRTLGGNLLHHFLVI